MTTDVRTPRLLEVVQEQFVMNMRPATLQEIANVFDVSPQTVRLALQEHIAEGAVVKLHGARGYMPSWAARAIVTEGLSRIEDPLVRDRIRRMHNQPVSARLCDCLRNQFGGIDFPNPSNADIRRQIALDILSNSRFVLDSIQPTHKGYDVIVHPSECDCGSLEIAWKCTECGRWVCETCVGNHTHRTM